jgi:hypothetical protein
MDVPHVKQVITWMIQTNALNVILIVIFVIKTHVLDVFLVITSKESIRKFIQVACYVPQFFQRAPTAMKFNAMLVKQIIICTTGSV